MKNTLTILFILSFLLGTSVRAQQIKGKVIDETTAEPLPFANIVVVEVNPDASVNGTVTDMDGNFALACNTESQSVRISYLGYKTRDVTISKSQANTIHLAQDDNMLGEVVIKAARKIIRMENGGISMDIASTPLVNIGTANDIIEKLPFVVKDGDEISVLGKGTPLIYINNRLVRDASELDKLSSNEIKKVTVITNPGPEYDASVSSVIRIEAVRNSGEGWGGDVYGMVDFRKKTTMSGSVDLNYRKNNLDIFASYWHTRNRREVDNSISRTLTTKDQTTLVNSSGTESHDRRSFRAEAGFNYDFNSRNSVGAKYSLLRMPFQDFTLDIPTTVHINNELADKLYTNSLLANTLRTHLVNAYYTGEAASWLKIQFDFDYSKGYFKTDQTSLTQRTSNENVSTSWWQNYDIYASKLTLTTPLWGSELKYGLEFSHTKHRQDYDVEENEGAEDLTSQTNENKQTLFAPFVGYSKTMDKWTVNLGLRYENVKFDYIENGVLREAQSKDYSNLFPSVSVNYQNDNVQMSLAYRATIARPSYYNLRNGIQYDDPYTYETGNPSLQPTKTNDITYSLLWKKFKLMASYKLHKNLVLWFPQQYEDKNIVIYRNENVDKAQNLSVTAYYSPRVGIWEPTAGIGMSKYFLEYGPIVKKKYEKPYFYYSLQNIFKLPAGFVLMADVRGNLSGHSKLVYEYSQVRVDVGITKTFLKDKLILNLKGADIFGTYRDEFSVDAPPVYTYLRKNLDTRSVVLSVRYKFNATRSKYKGESVSAEERKRL